MTRVQLTLPILAAMGVVVIACEKNDVQALEREDAATDAGDRRPDGGADASATDAALAAMFGLDERPSTRCVAPGRPPDTAARVRVEPAFPGLSFDQPVALLQAPGDPTHWYVVEQAGRVKVFDNDPTAMTATTLLDISSDVNNGPNEAGLLGMAFHPAFATNRTFFLSYTRHSASSAADLRSTVSRFVMTEAGTVDPASAQTVLPPDDNSPNLLDQPYGNHNGGNIAFGPDGYLYYGLGDGGAGGDPQNRSQNTRVLFGKMLRVDVDHAPNGARYGIPPTNPFANGGGSNRPEIFAWGLRNPWRFSFDRETGELWVGDVGQDAWEEVDIVQNGGNYGWKIREGKHCYPEGTPRCSTAGLIDPIIEYPHAGGGRSIVGGFVYRGRAIPELIGKYVYADTIVGEIYTIEHDETGVARHTRIGSRPGAYFVSFAQDASGELLVVDLSGAIFNLSPMGTPQPDTFPQRLSETGCVDANDPQRPAPGVIPYEVNASLWSDGAGKERWLSVPDGTQIEVGADGDLDFPNGSVLMKRFLLAGRPVETRLMMRHPDGVWAGYSYRWNDEGTEATLLAGGLVSDIAGQSWTFPSRPSCLTCHTEAAGRSLGLELGQLNRMATYPSTGRTANQLATLDHIGLFSTPIGDPAAITAYPNLEDTAAPVEARARAYLASNCSFCHRPNGGGRGPADFRFAQPFAMTHTCDQMPEAGDLGVSGARLLVPGAPERSLISLRMHALDLKRMPPLASRIVDSEGTQLIDAWISSVGGCP